ncbi:MAG TPA: FAD-binding oxidoreductase [Magnetovibrio sp.]
MSAKALIDAIQAVVGPKGITTDAAAMSPYLDETRGLYQGTAPAVAKPANTQEVAEIVKLCAAARVPIVAQGGNTGLVGGAVPEDAIVLSLERMNTIEAVDPVNLTMTVQAGCILADVQTAAADAGAYFPLSLGAEGSCRIGGNLSTNAGGVHVLRYGNARDLVLGLEVVLADGRVWNGLRGLRKDNTGYDLKALFLGAEGTLGIITRAVLRLYPKPQSTCVALAGCGSAEAALELFQTARSRAGEVLSACEYMNTLSLDLAEKHIAAAKCPLEGRHAAYVLLEFTSSDADADLNALMEAVLSDAFEAACVEDAVIAQSHAQAQAIWALREAVPEAQKLEGGSIKHDVSVPVSKVAEFLGLGTELVERLIPNVRTCAFGHIGDGNIHFNLTQPEGADKQAFLDQWDATNRAVHDVVMAMNGSFSAEHGVGRLKTGEMARLKDPVELDLMRTLKAALDPLGVLNPGKVLPTATEDQK